MLIPLFPSQSMSQNFYSSGYDLGSDQNAVDNSWTAPGQQQYTAPAQQYAQPEQQPQQYAAQQAYEQAQYNNQNQFGYNPGQVDPAQQQSFYASPQAQQYAPQPAQQQPYSSPAATSNASFYSSGTSFYDPNSNLGSMGPAPSQPSGTSDSFEDEQPLMEELGIDLPQIYQTTMTVLNPSKPAATTLMDDPDLSGPIIFCLGFGALLLLSGKVHFGYIYGVALIGTAAMYTLLNLMSVNGVSVGVTISVLGYCMLPMCALAGLSALLSLNGTIGLISCAMSVSWASWASSKLFVSVLAMYDQQPLVAYPCALMYGIFAVLTVF